MIANSVAKSVASSVARSVAGAASSGGWTPLEISANAKVFTSSSGVTSSGSADLYTWNRTRDNRPWGDWVGRDSVFTYVEGDGRPVMYGGWSNGSVAVWNSTFLTNEVWTSYDDGATWELILADDPSPTTRPEKRHLGARCYATFNNIDYVYMMGGVLDLSGGPQTPLTVDVWRKPLDGDPASAWERMTTDAGMGGRDNMFMGFLDGVLYAGGGYTGVGNTVGAGLGVQDDLWKSIDEGENWTLVTGAAPWGPTAACGQELLTRDGKLWKFGGWVATTGSPVYVATNDVWTYDGTNFVEVLATGHVQWAERFYHNVALWNGEFYVVTGHNEGAGNLGDVFRSTDGATWTQLPTIPFQNTHAMSVFPLAETVVFQNGYRQTDAGAAYSDGVFSTGSYTLHLHTACPRVDSWGGGGLTLSGTTDARPYLVDSFIAAGRKTIFFDAAQYMTLASQSDFTGSGAVLIAGKFPNMATSLGQQTIVASDTDLALGLLGIGTFAMDSSSDTAMPRFHPNHLQRGDLRTIAFSMDGTRLRQWIDTDEIDCDGETFTLSGWSKLGGGHTSATNNLKGHIVAIAVIPDAEVTQADVEAFRTWALSKAGVTETADATLTALAPDQLLLQDNKPAFYTEAEWPLHSHYLKDHSVAYRTGDPVPGFAPQPCLTGDGTNYVTLAFGTYRPGKSDAAITVEFSIKTSATLSSRGVACSVNATSGFFNWIIQQTAAGKISWYQSTQVGAAQLISTATLAAGTWYRIKYVRTGSTGAWNIKLYINGVLDSEVDTADDPGASSASTTTPYLFHTASAFTRFNGSLADVSFIHDGHKWFVPLMEGTRTNAMMLRSDGVVSSQSAITDAAMWAGVYTEPAAMARNWLLTNGGTVELGQTTLIPGNFNGVTTALTGADNLKCTIFPGKFAQGTIDCDPTAVGAGGLGLESALTPTTERDTASSGLRRRRVTSANVDRLAANATAMSSTAANEYFRD